jgi:hypothetical protein
MNIRSHIKNDVGKLMFWKSLKWFLENDKLPFLKNCSKKECKPMLLEEIHKLTSSGPKFFFKIPTFCMTFKDICERLVHFLD